MIRLALYLAFGVIFHLIFVGARFDVTNLWSWLWLLGWPLALMVWGIVVGAVLTPFVLAALWIRERLP